jgi:hypothetical protein
MNPYTLLFCGAALAASAGGAFAGEDSTHRWHGDGPAWYEVEGGLRRFAAGDPYEPNPRAEEARERAERYARSKQPAPSERINKQASDSAAAQGNLATK